MRIWGIQSEARLPAPLKGAATALVAACVLINPAIAAEPSAIRSITVTGQAERRVVPDEAHVQVQIAAQNMKLADAKAEHDAKLKSVMDIAKAHGIDAAKVKSNSSNVQPQYIYENNKQIFKGYRVATSLDITVADTNKVGGFVEKILGAGLENKTNADGTGLVSIAYSVANPDKVRDELSSDAIANARAKAERMADAAGAKLGQVLQVSEGNVPNFERPHPLPMMMLSRGVTSSEVAPSSAPPAGEQELSTTVTVTYELKN